MHQRAKPIVPQSDSLRCCDMKLQTDKETRNMLFLCSSCWPVASGSHPYRNHNVHLHQMDMLFHLMQGHSGKCSASCGTSSLTSVNTRQVAVTSHADHHFLCSFYIMVSHSKLTAPIRDPSRLVCTRSSQVVLLDVFFAFSQVSVFLKAPWLLWSNMLQMHVWKSYIS